MVSRHIDNIVEHQWRAFGASGNIFFLHCALHFQSPVCVGACRSQQSQLLTNSFNLTAYILCVEWHSVMCWVVDSIVDIDSLLLQEDPNKRLLLSQHCFGWPEHRPRLYTIMTRDATCSLKDVNMIHRLFRRPVLPVSSLFCAPQASG